MSYEQSTFDTDPWVALNDAGACVGYVIAPKAEYVIRGKNWLTRQRPPASRGARPDELADHSDALGEGLP